MANEIAVVYWRNWAWLHLGVHGKQFCMYVFIDNKCMQTFINVILYFFYCFSVPFAFHLIALMYHTKMHVDSHTLFTSLSCILHILFSYRPDVDSTASSLLFTTTLCALLVGWNMYKHFVIPQWLSQWACVHVCLSVKYT